MISGTIAFKSSMTTNPASMLPKSRIQSDNGRMTISKIMIGATIGIGCAKCFAQCPNPFLRIPENSMRHILMIARLPSRSDLRRSLKPNNGAIVFEQARYNRTVIRYVHSLVLFPKYSDKEVLSGADTGFESQLHFSGISTFKFLPG